MHKVLQLTFPELERIFTSRSDLFLNFVQLFTHPDCVLGLSKTIIKNRIRANTNKKISNITAEKKAIQILEIAKICYPTVSQNDVLCDQIKLYARRYQELLHQKESCISKLVYVAEQRAEYDVIRSLPGIGPNTAVRLMAEIGDITRLTITSNSMHLLVLIYAVFNQVKPFLKIKSINVEINICGSSFSSSSRT